MLSEPEVLDWVRSRSRLNEYSVRLKALDELKGWGFDPLTGNLEHSSRKFFRVEGLDVHINSGSVQCWQQPIIVQPEIGILGFIAQSFDGVLHLLVQAKMEPGNINFIQISPTVQATQSNYTQVHGGNRPTFIEYFLDQSEGHVLVDQLQSEQGTRYLRKRNRNIIIQMPDDFSLTHSADYVWVTIGQLQKLMRFPNLVHLDCRSILGSLSYQVNDQQRIVCSDLPQTKFTGRVRASICAADDKAESDMPSVLSWLTRLKCQTEVKTRLQPLNEVAGWSLTDGVIKHESGEFFSVVGVDVTASNREVAGWSQPLIYSVDGGIIGMVSQMRRDVLHFLIQGRVEPGLIDVVELAPTVQCTPSNYLNGTHLPLPAFVELFQSQSREQIRFDSKLSDEGGRFYHSQQRHLVIEVDAGLNVELPPDYCWMTLRQIQECARFSNLINIELRSILACLSLAD
jgi:oxidase EvaA